MNEPRPLVSVVVSVRGNAGSLRALLTALAAQTLPVAELEAVIVDNDPPGSGGRVAALVDPDSWPFAVRVVRQSRAGLSAGRNRGVCAARGRFIAITDPDIVPETGWLAGLVTAAREEGVFAVGGRTTVTYPQGCVFPLDQALAECHGALDWPTERAAALWPFWVTGCNLLFDRQIALDLGLFRTDLGRKGRWLGDCEDLEFVDRARQNGHTILIEPAAHAIHPVYRAETHPVYFVRQGIGHGICLARMHRTVGVEPAAIRADRDAVKDAIGSLICGWGFLRTSDAVNGVRDLARIAAYHTERARLRVMGARTLPIRPMNPPVTEPREDAA